MPHATQHADTAAQAPAAELDTALQGGPFHVALRAAIAARGLPLQRVQHHLSRYGVRVGVTSLSYWQQGARRPQRPESLRAVRALEEILHLPDESLIRLLAESDDGHGATSARASEGRSYRSLLEASGALEQLLTELECSVDGGLHTLGHHERVRIGARRELSGRESQHIVRAHRDGVDRFVAVHHGDPGCAPERMTVHALENCRAGRVRRHHDTGVLVAEFLFDTRLRTGETFLFRYGVEDGTAGVCREYVRGFGGRRPVRPAGPLHGERASRALPPLHPALGRGPARRPPGAAAQRPAPLGAPGGAAGAVGDGRHRLGLGLNGCAPTRRAG